MYLKIGSVLRNFNEVKTPSISYKPFYDSRRRVAYIEEQWQISGRIVLQTNATQTRMTQALQQLESDWNQIRPSLLFVEDNGVTPSHLKLNASECFDGPNIVDASFPGDAADVYATGMLWAVTVSAKRLPAGVGNPLLEFSESVARVSGGTIIGFVGGAINYPERQIFKQHEPYIYEQSGRAVGLFGYPSPPPALWPGAQLEEMKPVLVSPRVMGSVDSEFEIQWSYRFGNEFPLSGLPHTFA